MDEENENQLPIENFEEQLAPKKRRGRKPKALKELENAQAISNGSTSDSAQELETALTQEIEVAPAPKKRGRKPKAQKAAENQETFSTETSLQAAENFVESNSAENPQFSENTEREAQGDNYNEEAEFESYSRRNREREHNKRNDEFSFAGDSEYQETETPSEIDEFDADEIPESFSTSDEDLIHDSYRNNFDEDSLIGEDFPPEPSDSAQEAIDESDSRGNPQEMDIAGEQPADSAPENVGEQRQMQPRNFDGRRNQTRPNGRQERRDFGNRNPRNQQNRNQQNQNRNFRNPQNRNPQNQNRNAPQNRNAQMGKNSQMGKWMKFGDRKSEEIFAPEFYLEKEELKTAEGLETLASSITEQTPIFEYSEIWSLGKKEFDEYLTSRGIEHDAFAGQNALFISYLKHIASVSGAIKVSGVLDVFEGGKGGAICFASDSYKLKKFNVYVPQKLIEQNGLLRGCEIVAYALAPADTASVQCPLAVKIESVMGMSAKEAMALTPFNELTPYYPTRRIILETPDNQEWDNFPMRVVDLLTPIGFGQRALIVAPPRTGKTVLMQGMAKSIRQNQPNAHVIVLMVDERPEEVTDFKRSVDAEIIASTFDEDAFSHVHAAEMVISKARRMVETGRDVVILLDSITRLARAYNTLMPNSGKIMSGGVEANALQKPKRFFGSARNIEGGGSLTIIGTALVETGSKMDEVIFEEFKGTGNLELHLDRALSDKRIFPAINIEKSGTRKEEMLYHPDEMTKVYALRRSMKGVLITDAMELFIQRLKKMKTNVEFLLGMCR